MSLILLYRHDIKVSNTVFPSTYMCVTVIDELTAEREHQYQALTS